MIILSQVQVVGVLQVENKPKNEEKVQHFSHKIVAPAASKFSETGSAYMNLAKSV